MVCRFPNHSHKTASTEFVTISKQTTAAPPPTKRNVCRWYTFQIDRQAESKRASKHHFTFLYSQSILCVNVYVYSIQFFVRCEVKYILTGCVLYRYVYFTLLLLHVVVFDELSFVCVCVEYILCLILQQQNQADAKRMKTISFRLTRCGFYTTKW